MVHQRKKIVDVATEIGDFSANEGHCVAVATYCHYSGKPKIFTSFLQGLLAGKGKNDTMQSVI